MRKVDTTFLEKQIKELKEYMKIEEKANDYYYTKGTQSQDARHLRHLEYQVAEIKAGRNPFPENASER